MDGYPSEVVGLWAWDRPRLRNHSRAPIRRLLVEHVCIYYSDTIWRAYYQNTFVWYHVLWAQDEESGRYETIDVSFLGVPVVSHSCLHIHHHAKFPSTIAPSYTFWGRTCLRYFQSRLGPHSSSLYRFYALFYNHAKVWCSVWTIFRRVFQQNRKQSILPCCHWLTIAQKELYGYHGLLLKFGGQISLERAVRDTGFEALDHVHTSGIREEKYYEIKHYLRALSCSTLQSLHFYHIGCVFALILRHFWSLTVTVQSFWAFASWICSWLLLTSFHSIGGRGWLDCHYKWPKSWIVYTDDADVFVPPSANQ